ncbi:MAG TPA: sigma-70 family RNA polymerase sigma factor [Verrucomicrobiae bacterium]|nr:sigma-70 family RNA polymerase sigma factor [Verrucomicrobiae bacterium]
MQISNANLLLSLNIQPVAEVSVKNAGADVASLTAEIRAGNEEAFREFHRLYFHRLYQFLLVVARGQEHEAREALQETLLRVVRHARKFDSEEAFWCWLKIVARNAARDRGRKEHRYLGLLQKFALHSQNSAKPPSLPDGPMIGEALEESLAALPPQDRHIIESKYLQGLTVRELAADTGLTEKAVESRLLRLRQQIRELILKKLQMP